MIFDMRSVSSHTLRALLLCLASLVWATGCRFSLFEDECTDDGDCPGSKRCASGLLSTYCARECTSHEDCRASEYCRSARMFQSFPECHRGCRSDAACASGLACLDGECIPGCRSDAECDLGYTCHLKQCALGCRGDADCSPGEICRPGSQLILFGDPDPPTCEPGCRSDADCLGGGCVFLPFSSSRCVPPVQCGEEATCHAGANMPPCCLPSDPVACGVEVIGLTCSRLEPVADEGPGPCEAPAFYSACRTPSGECGALVGASDAPRCAVPDPLVDANVAEEAPDATGADAGTL
jgi:hypothetical protein